MSGILEGVTAAETIAAEVVAEVPNAEKLIVDVINFLHLHFPGAAGLPPKPMPTVTTEAE